MARKNWKASWLKMASDTIQVTSINEAAGRVLSIARRDFNPEIQTCVDPADTPAPKSKMKAAVPIRATNHHARKRA
jgi:hypothetical protein